MIGICNFVMAGGALRANYELQNYELRIEVRLRR